MQHSRDLLAQLSILPDGLSDVELKQSELPIKETLGCKAALLRTALAYIDNHERLKVLIPVREYMARYSPPTDNMIMPLLAHFHELLELYVISFGKESGVLPIARITSNYTNIQNVLRCGLQLQHPDMTKSIYCICNLNFFTALDHLKHLSDPELESKFHRAVAWYYSEHVFDMPNTINHCQTALSLARANRNYKSPGGNHTAGQAYAQEAQKGQDTSGLCGMSQDELVFALMISQAEVYKQQSEYLEVHNVQNQLLQALQLTDDPFQLVFTLINTCEIRIQMGVSKDLIQEKISTARAISTTLGNSRCLRLSWGNFSEVVSYCLEHLGDTSRWKGSQHPSLWTTFFLANSLKTKEKLAIHKALHITKSAQTFPDPANLAAVPRLGNVITIMT
ncbi:hypothetical protein B0H16DRAFT_1468703 [Mycena metata]|uniref:Uncharacterized protein n=1 Tax=Mycena metata TaxID=1033252 RepID=A0AAD7MU25_9AGAR|nr:hypothetical protein B0H16DRAFT_1468703 [Mycena metata]